MFRKLEYLWYEYAVFEVNFALLIYRIRLVHKDLLSLNSTSVKGCYLHFSPVPIISRRALEHVRPLDGDG